MQHGRTRQAATIQSLITNMMLSSWALEVGAAVDMMLTEVVTTSNLLATVRESIEPFCLQARV